MSDLNTFDGYLENTRLTVKNCLENHLNAQKLILEEIDEFTANRIINALIAFSVRGKMFRAAALGLAFETVGHGYKAKLPVDVQAGIELIQTGLLIQDDIVDRDELRRGVPTIHHMFASESLDWNKEISSENAADIGRAMAMMASDLAIVLAYDLFLDGAFSPEIVIKATSQFNRNLVKTALGQAMDVSLHNPLANSDRPVLKASMYKTAYYTVIGPMQLGATLAGAGDALIHEMEVFGRNIGLAYQLRDDILDIFGEVDDSRRRFSDICGNKPTFLIENTINMTSGREHDVFLSSLGRNNPSVAQMNTVREIVRSSGALSATVEKSECLVNEGKKLIPTLTNDEVLSELLRELCEYAICRED